MARPTQKDQGLPGSGRRTTAQAKLQGQLSFRRARGVSARTNGGEVSAVAYDSLARMLGNAAVRVRPADGGKQVAGVWFSHPPHLVDELFDVVDRGEHGDQLGGVVGVPGCCAPLVRRMCCDEVMTTEGRAHGRCDCGGVEFVVTGPLRDVYNCHCERCRRITGHHMAATAVSPDQITFTSDATLRWYDPVPTVHYGFCSTCGSTLFWKADDIADKLCISAGTLDQPTKLRTTKAWWVAEAGDYHERQQGLQDFSAED